MPTVFAPETLEGFRLLDPREAHVKVRELLYRSGARSSEDFREAYEELVAYGILTWEQVEEFEG